MQSSETSNRLRALSTSPPVKQEPESQLTSLVSILKPVSAPDSGLLTTTRPTTRAEMVFLWNFGLAKNPMRVKRLQPVATSGYPDLPREAIKYPEYFVIDSKRSNSK